MGHESPYNGSGNYGLAGFYEYPRISKEGRDEFTIKADSEECLRILNPSSIEINLFKMDCNKGTYASDPSTLARAANCDSKASTLKPNVAVMTVSRSSKLESSREVISEKSKELGWDVTTNVSAQHTIRAEASVTVGGVFAEGSASVGAETSIGCSITGG